MYLATLRGIPLLASTNIRKSLAHERTMIGAIDGLLPGQDLLSGPKVGGAGWLYWAVALPCVVFTLWIVFDIFWVKATLRRRIGLDADHEGPRKRQDRSGEFFEATCRHCKKQILIAKRRAYEENHCPFCDELNPAFKKRSLFRLLLRRLLYPSFQDRL
jgi:hypothetical protein